MIERTILLILMVALLLLAACSPSDATTTQTAAPAAGNGETARPDTGARTAAVEAEAAGGTASEATPAATAGPALAYPPPETATLTAGSSGDGGRTVETTTPAAVSARGAAAETATARTGEVTETLVSGADVLSETLAATRTLATGTATAQAAIGGGGGAILMPRIDDCDRAGPKVDRLTWWTPVAEGAPAWPHLQNVARAYTEQTGTPVEIVAVLEAEFKARLAGAAPAGEGPDVMGPLAHAWAGELALQRIAAEIPIDSVQAREAIARSSFDAATVDGKLYGIPLFVESVALIRNTNLMPGEVTSFDELLAQAQELNRADQAGFIFPALEQYHAYAIIRGFGGYIFKFDKGRYDTGDVGLNNQGAVAGFKFLRDLVNGNPSFAGLNRRTQRNLSEGKMESGRAGATIDGPWAIPGLQKAGVPIAVQTLPALPNGKAPRPFTGVQVMVAGAYSKKMEAALDFTRFVGCSASILELYKGLLMAPARRDVLGEEPVKSGQFIAVWLAQAEQGEPLPNVPAMSSVWEPWGRAMDAIITGNAPDDAIQGILDTAVQQIKDAIAAPPPQD